MVVFFIITSVALKFVVSDPLAHISHSFTNHLNGLESYPSFIPSIKIPNCFSPQPSTTPFLQTINKLEPRELLSSIEYQGCKGMPMTTDDQLRMQKCCENLKADTNLQSLAGGTSGPISSAYGLYDQVCSNLNILSLAQRICQEFKRNEPKYHSDFKNLFSSKDFTVFFGQISYMEFHKAMVAMILQHILAMISKVEQELGWNLTDGYEGRGGLDRMSECFN